MFGRRSLGISALVVALFAAPVLTLDAGAQQSASGRYRVLVPDFQPTDNSDDDFGKDLADELREAISDLNTHTAVEEGDIKDDLKRFKMKMEELDCIRSRQLAQQSNYEVVLCASYAAAGDGFAVASIQFVDTRSGESFPVEGFEVAEKEEEVAASRIVDQFELFVEQTRAASFCSDYAQSQQWENSIQNCDRALELNPDANSVRYTRASVLRNMERYEESLEEIDRVLEANPFHENALLLGGFVAVTLDRAELARQYYRKYLELDPTNATVRMRVAFDLAQEGDPFGGMELIEEGMAADPENIEFYKQHGNFAFAAARNIADENRMMGRDEVTPEVEELYRKAIDSYGRVMDSPEAEVLPSQLRNAAAAYLQLGEAGESAAFTERALEQFGDDASLWMIYADALREDDRIDEALVALQAVERIDPDYAQLHLRMANLLLQADRLQEAVPFLETAVEKGTPADQAANMIFANGHSRYIQPDPKNYVEFIDVIQLAKSFEVSSMAQQTYDFWHGYAVFQRGIQLNAPENLESANLTLPMFREALGLFQSSKDYADSQPSINYAQFIENTGVYIEIQEAIIKRGR